MKNKSLDMSDGSKDSMTNKAQQRCSLCEAFDAIYGLPTVSMSRVLRHTVNRSDVAKESLLSPVTVRMEQAESRSLIKS